MIDDIADCEACPGSMVDETGAVLLELATSTIDVAVVADNEAVT